MIGELPQKLSVNGTCYPIRADYRNCLTILQAYADNSLKDSEKNYIMLARLYKDFDAIEEADYEEAAEQAVWFLNCGNTVQESGQEERGVYDWELDEQSIFAAVNKVAGHDVRMDSYMHFWTFIGYFNEIGESTFATLVRIRDKLNRNERLDEWEKKYYTQHREQLELGRKPKKEVSGVLQKLNRLLK